MITLTEIMRQKDDVAFAEEMLNRICAKEKSEALSEADRDLLSQAVTEPELKHIKYFYAYIKSVALRIRDKPDQVVISIHVSLGACVSIIASSEKQ